MRRREIQASNAPVLLDAQDIARVLRTTPRAVYNMWFRGQLPQGFKLGRRRYLAEADLLAWLEEKQAASAEETR